MKEDGGGGGGTAKSEGTAETPISNDHVGRCGTHKNAARGVSIPANKDAAASADMGGAACTVCEALITRHEA